MLQEFRSTMIAQQEVETLVLIFQQASGNVWSLKLSIDKGKGEAFLAALERRGPAGEPSMLDCLNAGRMGDLLGFKVFPADKRFGAIDRELGLNPSRDDEASEMPRQRNRPGY